MERWLVISNCQTQGLAHSMQLLARDIVVDPLDIGTYLTQAEHFNAHVGAYDRVLIGYGAKTTPQIDLAKARRADTLPEIGFTAYHPDLAYILEGETVLNGAVGAYHSIIAFVAHGLGRTVDDALSLFNGRVYGTCGYYDCWTAARDELVGYCDYLGFDVSQAVRKWARNGPFMFSTNHPRIQVLYDIARIYLEREGYETHASDILPHDNLVNSGVFPVYPEIGDVLGVAGNYLFKRVNEYTQIGLRQFVEESFAVYDRYEPGALAVNERSKPTFERVTSVVNETMLAA